MLTVLKRLKKNKTPILCFVLLLMLPFAAGAEIQDKEIYYWVRIDEKKDSLAAAQKIMADLPDEIKKDKLRICMVENEYALVYTGAKDPDAAFLIREKLSQHLNRNTKTDLVQYDPAQCFSTGHFLKKTPVKKHQKVPLPPKQPQKASTLNASVHIYPDIGRYNKKGKKELETTDRTAVLSKSMVKILSEVSTQVYLSNLDINRITCMGNRPVKDVIYSVEKGITTKINGSNAFIKLQMHRNSLTSKPEVVDEPVELYVVCGNGNDVYTIIGIPKKIPAQWVQLVSKTDNIKKNLSLFDGKDFEKKIVTLIKQAWTENYSDSYTIEKIDRPLAIKGLGWIDITLRRIVDIDGEGFLIKEYILLLNGTVVADEQNVLEKQFVLPQLSENPLAITLDALTIKKDIPTRLFIVERSDREPRIGMSGSTNK